MKLSALLLPEEYISLYDANSIDIDTVEIRSDRVRPGSLFICLRGSRYDAHCLLDAVYQKGAVAAVVEAGAEIKAPAGLPTFTVPDSRLAFAMTSYRLAGCPGRRMCLVAVTGTNGKTSTASMLAHILRTAGKRTALIGTLGASDGERSYLGGADPARRHMTTPDPDLLYPVLREMEENGVTHVVLEASSHALDQEKLVPLRFALGIFTNISPEHLDYHGGMNEYLAAKAKLFALSDAALFNFDSEGAEEIARELSCPVLRCGAVYHEEYNAEEIRIHGTSGVSYVYATPNLRMAVTLPTPGSFTVYNSLLALTAAIHLGIPPLAAGDALRTLPGVPGRMERVLSPEEAGFSLFVDYAHTEAALRHLLLTVRGFRRGHERIVLLFGCGGDRDKKKRAPMGRTAEDLADFVIVTSDNSRREDPPSIIYDILGGMKRREKRRVILDRRRAICYAIEEALPDDIILLVGKGHETYEVSEGTESPLDEKEIVYEALRARKEKEKHAHST